MKVTPHLALLGLPWPLGFGPQSWFLNYDPFSTIFYSQCHTAIGWAPRSGSPPAPCPQRLELSSAEGGCLPGARLGAGTLLPLALSHEAAQRHHPACSSGPPCPGAGRRPPGRNPAKCSAGVISVPTARAAPRERQPPAPPCGWHPAWHCRLCGTHADGSPCRMWLLGRHRGAWGERCGRCAAAAAGGAGCWQVAVGSGACGLFTQGGGGSSFVWRRFGREPRCHHPNVAPCLVRGPAWQRAHPCPCHLSGGCPCPPSAAIAPQHL